MAIAITSRGGGSQTGTTSHTVTFSTTPTEGQLLVVVFRRDGGSVINAPTGWAEHEGPFAAEFDAYVFVKIAGPSEPLSHTFTFNSATNASHRFFTISGFTGPVTTDNLRVSGTFFASSSTPDPPTVLLPSVPSIPVDQFVGIAVAVWDSGGASLSSYPSGYINGGNHTSASGVNIASAEFLGDEFTLYSQVNPGAFTLSASRRSLGITIVAIAASPPENNTASVLVNENADTVQIPITQTNAALSYIQESPDLVTISATQQVVASVLVTENSDSVSIPIAQVNSSSVQITETKDSVTINAVSVVGASVLVNESSDSAQILATQALTGNVLVQENSDTVSIGTTQTNAGSVLVPESSDTVSIGATQTNTASVLVAELKDSVLIDTDLRTTGQVLVVESGDSIVITSTQQQEASVLVNENSDSVSVSTTTVLTGSVLVQNNNDTVSVSSTQTNVAQVLALESSDTVSIQTTAEINSVSVQVQELSDTVSVGATQTNVGSVLGFELQDQVLFSTSGDGAGPLKCCCGDCPGCCFPYDYLEPPDVMQAGNYAQILRWEIDAPNCPALDGLTGQFSPETTGPHDPLVFCGFCLCYNNTNLVVTLDGIADYDNGGICAQVPCGITICFGLQCGRERQPADPADCWKAFRFIVVFIGGYPTGGQLVDTNGQCFEGEGIGGNPNFPGCNITQDFPEDIARELLPASGQCEDPNATPPVPFQLVFNLSDLTFGCNLPNFPSGHPCEGLSPCCYPVNCSLVDATVTITRL